MRTSLVPRLEQDPAADRAPPPRRAPALQLALALFVFSIPVEAWLSQGGGPTLARLTGYLLLFVALFNVRAAFVRPPPAWWAFVAYLAIATIWGVVGWSGNEDSVLLYLQQRGQLVVMFWIAYSLLLRDNIARSTVRAYALGTMVLAGLQILMAPERARATVFGTDPNELGSVVALGMIIFVGEAGAQLLRLTSAWRWAALFVLSSALVLSGSRGAVLVLFIGLAALIFKKQRASRWLITAGGVAVGLGIAVALIARSEAATERWIALFVDRDVSLRDLIYPAAWEMVLEKPWLGWGPGHLKELGLRVAGPIDVRDYVATHNVGLWVLTGTGILGAIPFFTGVGLCIRGAWRARYSSRGALPVALVAGAIAYGMSVDADRNKAYWLFLAYGLASGDRYRAMAVPQDDPESSDQAE